MGKVAQHVMKHMIFVPNGISMYGSCFLAWLTCFQICRPQTIQASVKNDALLCVRTLEAPPKYAITKSFILIVLVAGVCMSLPQSSYSQFTQVHRFSLEPLMVPRFLKHWGSRRCRSMPGLVRRESKLGHCAKLLIPEGQLFDPKPHHTVFTCLT